MPCLNPFHTIKIMLYVMHGNSHKLGPKPIKPVLESSFYPKLKNESNHLIGMVSMIQPYPVCCLLSVSLGSVSKNCEVIIFLIIQELLFLVLTCLDCFRIYRVCKSQSLLQSQKCTKILENGKECVQSISRPLLVKKFFNLETATGCNYKISNGKVGLITYL